MYVLTYICCKWNMGSQGSVQLYRLLCGSSQPSSASHSNSENSGCHSYHSYLIAQFQHRCMVASELLTPTPLQGMAWVSWSTAPFILVSQMPFISIYFPLFIQWGQVTSLFSLRSVLVPLPYHPLNVVHLSASALTICAVNFCGLDKCIISCIHYYHYVTDWLPCLKKSLVPHLFNVFPFPNTWQPVMCLSIFITLSFPKSRIIGVIQ